MSWDKEGKDLTWWALLVVLVVMVVCFVLKVIEFRTGMIILEVLK